ncbi:N-arachidonyl glycine receptor isoform X1 [Hippocampus comes]|uniref:N-arachidonyl glycine receptor isoform X1 n=2 Tax=Hippocampus comes TaxID=109280 RepID=UPI00094E3647|nr:PREDICTED: N-arachidonyl glycine receptor isoform X1 [Hippocampus comes]
MFKKSDFLILPLGCSLVQQSISVIVVNTIFRMTLLPNSSHTWLPVEHRTFGLVFYSCVFIIGVIVNMTALWVFALTTKRRSSVTIYMINVALVDLTFILMLPFRMVYLQRDFWPFGDLLCRVSATLNVFYPCIALWLFGLISADRYLAIVQPKQSKELRNVPKTVVACLGAWLMTLAATASLLFSADDPDGVANFTTCLKTVDFIYLRHNGPVNFTWIAFFFLLPICIMIGCYVVIVDNLIRGRASKLKPKVKQKSIRIIITLIVQVLVCFVPFHVCLLLHLLGLDKNEAFRKWAVFSTFLMNLSNVLDIILYYSVSKEFQERVFSVILYRNYQRSVRRKSRHTSSMRSISNVTSGMI